MKKIFIILFCVLALFMSCCLNGCNATPLNEKAERSVTLNSVFIGMVGFTQDELFKDINNIKDYSFSEVTKNEDGSITITGEDEELNKLAASKNDLLRELQTDFSEIHEGYKIVVNDDYTEVDYYLTQDITMFMFAYSFWCAADYAAYCQLFYGINNYNDFTMILNIYNSETGKLVISHDINNLGKDVFTPEDWARSYE